MKFLSVPTHNLNRVNNHENTIENNRKNLSRIIHFINLSVSQYGGGMSIETRKALFEKFMLENIPDFDETLLNDFDIENGYKDETVCAMWVGFCAGLHCYAEINGN